MTLVGLGLGLVIRVNSFFVGVGPGLAGESTDTGNWNKVGSKNVHVTKSMYIKKTDEKEINDIVKGFKSDKSTNLNDLEIVVG